MPAYLTAAHFRSAAARLGWKLGASQADEHVRLTGATRLAGPQLTEVARMAWKYEGKPVLGTNRDERAFIEAYVLAYRSRTH